MRRPHAGPPIMRAGIARTSPLWKRRFPTAQSTNTPRILRSRGSHSCHTGHRATRIPHPGSIFVYGARRHCQRPCVLLPCFLIAAGRRLNSAGRTTRPGRRSRRDTVARHSHPSPWRLFCGACGCGWVADSRFFKLAGRTNPKVAVFCRKPMGQRSWHLDLVFTNMPSLLEARTQDLSTQREARGA